MRDSSLFICSLSRATRTSMWPLPKDEGNNTINSKGKKASLQHKGFPHPKSKLHKGKLVEGVKNMSGDKHLRLDIGKGCLVDHSITDRMCVSVTLDVDSLKRRVMCDNGFPTKSPTFTLACVLNTTLPK